MVNDSNFVFKRLLCILPIQLFIYTVIMIIVLWGYSTISTIINTIEISDNIVFYSFYIISLILGVVTTFLSTKLFFKDKIKKHMIKQLIIGTIIIQIIFMFVTLISGFNLIEQIIATMRGESSIDRLLYGKYYDDMLNSSLKIWKKECLITVAMHMFGGFIAVGIIKSKIKNWLIKENDVAELEDDH